MTTIPTLLCANEQPVIAQQPTNVVILPKSASFAANEVVDEKWNRWSPECESKSPIAMLPSEINDKQTLLDLFPNAIGIECLQHYLGNIGTVPPIPKEYIKRANLLDPLGNNGELYKDNYRLVFIPEYITIEVDMDSPFRLTEETEIMRLAGKKRRLIEIPNNRSLSFSGAKRRLKVPVTPNNIITLAQKGQKLGLRSRFDGLTIYSWKNVLDQNGDVGTGSSHWSFQRKGPIGRDLPYFSQTGQVGQKELAENAFLKIVPLGDRIFFHLISNINSGEVPQTYYPERTSCITRTNGGKVSWQSAISFVTADPLFSLSLSCFFVCSHNCKCGNCRIVAAVEVPA